MQNLLLLLFFWIQSFSFCSEATSKKSETSFTKMEMHLSAFGVESDNFPSIDVYIDFKKDSSNCVKSYYNPAFKSSSYKLSNEEIAEILKLLETHDLKSLKSEYKVSKTDQPSSTTTIYSGQRKIVVEDYGLEGESPLQELYKIVYKF